MFARSESISVSNKNMYDKSKAYPRQIINALIPPHLVIHLNQVKNVWKTPEEKRNLK